MIKVGMTRQQLERRLLILSKKYEEYEYRIAELNDRLKELEDEISDIEEALER